jgi:hypothetical protein
MRKPLLIGSRVTHNVDHHRGVLGIVRAIDDPPERVFVEWRTQGRLAWEWVNVMQLTEWQVKT